MHLATLPLLAVLLMPTEDQWHPPLGAHDVTIRYDARPPRHFGLTVKFFTTAPFNQRHWKRFTVELDSVNWFRKERKSLFWKKSYRLVQSPWSQDAMPSKVSYWTSTLKHHETFSEEQQRKLASRGSHIRIPLDPERVLEVAATGGPLTVEVMVDGKNYREIFMAHPLIFRGMQQYLKGMKGWPHSDLRPNLDPTPENSRSLHRVDSREKTKSATRHQPPQDRR